MPFSQRAFCSNLVCASIGSLLSTTEATLGAEKLMVLEPAAVDVIAEPVAVDVIAGNSVIAEEAAVGAEEVRLPDNSPNLRLTDGSFVTGELQDSDKPGVFRWRNPVFAKPFDFAIQGVSAIHYPANGDPQHPRGTYCFELPGGDMLFGTLINYSAEKVELDLIHLGTVHLKGNSLRRLQKWSHETDLIFQGPNGLVGWVYAENIFTIKPHMLGVGLLLVFSYF